MIPDARIACVDLNGVLDTFTGWRGPDHFDPVRPGGRAFLEALRSRGYRIPRATRTMSGAGCVSRVSRI
jgi:hypothetical protein